MDRNPRDQCFPCTVDNLLYRDRRAHSSSTSSRVISYRPRQKGHRMSIIGWIVLGLIAGFIASKVVDKEGQGLLLDIVLGIVGAVVVGVLFHQLGAAGVTGFNIYSMFVAVAGAIVVLLLYHAVTGRRAGRASRAFNASSLTAARKKTAREPIPRRQLPQRFRPRE